MPHGDEQHDDEHDEQQLPDLVAWITGRDFELSELSDQLQRVPVPAESVEREAAVAQIIEALDAQRVVGRRELARAWAKRRHPPGVPVRPSGEVFGRVRRAMRATNLRAGDLAFADLFKAAFGDEVRWVQDEGRWYICSRHTRLWSPEDREGATKRMSVVVGELTGEPRAKAIRDGLALAKPLVAMTPDGFNRDPMLLATPSCVVDLRTGKTRAVEPADLLTKSTAVPYEKGAHRPSWERHLRVLTRTEDQELEVDDEGFPDCEGDPELIAYLQELAGLSLLGEQRQPTVVYLYGHGGANGKGYYVEPQRRALGDYAGTLDETVLWSASDAHTTGLHDLRGQRFVVADEVQDRGRQLNTARLKRITGRGQMKARAMRRDNVSFEPSHTLWMTSNFPPNFGVDDDAVWRRAIVIETGPTIPPELRVDEDALSAALDAELPGILAWAVEGAARYLRRGALPATPLRVQMATEMSREESNALAGFLQERIAEGSSSLLVDVRLAYDAWLKDNEGDRTSAPPSRTLAALLRKEGLVVEKSNGKRWVRGVRTTASTGVEV